VPALRILVSRHSAFYSPLISTLAAGFLAREGIEATYGLLPPGVRARDLIRDGQVDIVQSAVSSSWGPMEQGERDLPVHFAQINQRDGFFLAAREPDAAFHWKKLEGAALLADHAGQPLTMLRYAARCQGVDWSSIRVLDAGDVDAIDAAFRAGQGAYVHQQAPGSGYVVASVGAAMPAVAFSSLCASRIFLATDPARRFLDAFREAREWVAEAPAADIARAQAPYFPSVPLDALSDAIARYQSLGCWQGDASIPADLYQQALEVFLASGSISRRHPYDEVVAPRPLSGS